MDRKKIETVISRLRSLPLEPSDRETILEALEEKLSRLRNEVPFQGQSTNHIQLPTSIPKKKEYRNRPLRDDLGRKENVVEFLKRVWQPEMDAGLLTRVALRSLDPSADAAVENWLARRPLPPEVRLPTKKETNDDALAKAGLAIKDLHRLRRAVDRRRSKASLPP